MVEPHMDNKLGDLEFPPKQRQIVCFAIPSEKWKNLEEST